jgi:hypothetical protein
MKAGLQTETPAWSASVATTPVKLAATREKKGTCSSVGSAPQTTGSTYPCPVTKNAIWSVPPVLTMSEAESAKPATPVAITARDPRQTSA